MLKHELRTLYLNKRKKIPDHQLRDFNNAIVNQLKNLNWSAIKCISLFLPIKNLNEVNTYGVLSFFKSHFPNIIIAIPKTNFNDLSIQHLQYSHNTVLEENKYHIPEPVCGNVILPSAIDAVFVPLLVFDTLGYRVGYGKGVYDRFLASCRNDVVKIGLSFFEPVNRIDNVDAFDVPLSYCITTNKVFCFSQE